MTVMQASNCAASNLAAKFTTMLTGGDCLQRLPSLGEKFTLKNMLKTQTNIISVREHIMAASFIINNFFLNFYVVSCIVSEYMLLIYSTMFSLHLQASYVRYLLFFFTDTFQTFLHNKKEGKQA